MKHLNLKQTIDSNNRYHVSMETISADLSYSFDRIDIFGLDNCISLEDGNTFKEKTINFFKNIIAKIKELFKWFKEKIFGNNESQNKELIENSKKFKEEIVDSKPTSKGNEVLHLNLKQIEDKIDSHFSADKYTHFLYSKYHNALKEIYGETDENYSYLIFISVILSSKNEPMLVNDFSENLVEKIVEGIDGLVSYLHSLTEVYSKNQDLKVTSDFIYDNLEKIREFSSIKHKLLGKSNGKKIESDTIEQLARKINDRVNVIGPLIDRSIKNNKHFLETEDSRDTHVLDNLLKEVLKEKISNVNSENKDEHDEKLILRSYYSTVSTAMGGIKLLEQVRRMYIDLLRQVNERVAT